MTDYQIRLAQPSDALEISLLYHKVYKGEYPDSLMRDVNLLRGFLSNPSSVWVIAEKSAEIVCSVVYEVDSVNRLAKTFGGVVLPEHRGASLLEKSMTFGLQALTRNSETGVEVIYATTRTATKAPQIVTEKLGYRKLGIFPNVHRTDTYETHCLVALFSGSSLQRRYTEFPLHPQLVDLYQIVQLECCLPALSIATPQQIQTAPPKKTSPQVLLEILDAPKYTIHRFRKLRDSGQLPFSFYPFHEPNVMMSSPDDEVQVFLYLSPLDKYCTIVGIRKPIDLDGKNLLETVSTLLRDRGVRYIETIVRADQLETVDHIINAGFIPSAYFPAFQVQGQYRYDYSVFSKTFEILDFSGIELAGVNKKYLLHYFEKWKERILDSVNQEETE
ncbi:hypothetical protein WDW37_01715 [Bdellovibrionota bacterium FG-1]